ncbi:MAG: nitroreductase [Mycetocola sp.]
MDPRTLLNAEQTDRVEVLEGLMRSRRSCRAFLPTPVPMQTIIRMLSIAQRSPSWCNTQPWQLEVTSGLATERLRAGLRNHIRTRGSAATAPDFAMPVEYTGDRLARRRESGWQLYDAVGIARGDRQASARQAAENVAFFGAPHVAIVTTATELGVYGAVDAGIYAGVLLLAAESMGIAAVAQAAIARYSPFVREHFGLDASQRVLLAVSFGYADDQHPANSFRTARAGLNEAARFHSE